MTKPPKPNLIFTPPAWAKLLFLRDIGATEIGAFGITDPDNPLYINDIQLVKQECSAAAVDFDDEGVADFMDKMSIDLHPVNFGRIWIHTHPNMSPTPSGVDENTFNSIFGKCDWAVMFILATSGDYTAALQFNKEIPYRLDLDVTIDYSHEFEGSDIVQWEKEYDEFVSERKYAYTPANSHYYERYPHFRGHSYYAGIDDEVTILKSEKKEKSKKKTRKKDSKEIFGSQEEDNYAPLLVDDEFTGLPYSNSIDDDRLIKLQKLECFGMWCSHREITCGGDCLLCTDEVTMNRIKALNDKYKEEEEVEFLGYPYPADDLTRL